MKVRIKKVSRPVVRAKAFSREVACDFFRVNTGTSGRNDFIGIITSYAHNTGTVGRNVTIDDGILRLHDWQEQGGSVKVTRSRLCEKPSYTNSL